MIFEEYHGKVVFVTGADSGIGMAQAQRFLENGAWVFGFDKKEDGLSHLSTLYQERFSYYVGSVSDKDAVTAAVNRCLAQFHKIDILLNTAGILDGYAATLDTDESLWEAVMDTNVKGLYLVTNAVLPEMLKRQAGVVVTMASIAGIVPGGGGAVYTASKHAIIGYTKQLAYDYSRSGIRANAIAPGAIKTPMNQADFAGGGEMADWVANETPAGRWATPREVADLTLFVASHAADYMHGEVLRLDGGWTIK
ncbi:NAD(P)-dependent dehydrogenase [Lentibacillus kapialis]|uniref:NAD(P)-dependent dehydrogenase n=1 Tax=Lentibacillus kapialis TaxID=340214 RepID=A0A917Q1R5_9BACI|nr:3-oxoacyl-ACP reductase [Lentibacillus kapialis]GGK06006.1 NAD(P)-dependent dehydrogenase [Lentibacillus kapialis]